MAATAANQCVTNDDLYEKLEEVIDKLESLEERLLELGYNSLS